MLGYFPPPRHDEDASSLFARGYDYFGRPAQRTVLRQLFGPANTIASLEFPCGLGHFIQALPPNYPLTLHTLFSEHTRLPYYAPFLSKQRVERLKVDMTSNGAVGMLRRAGLATNRPGAAAFFRHCPCCDAEDYAQSAERYWHRLHQLPGVEVCPKHEVWLENSNAPVLNRRSRLEYISAERSTRTTLARPLEANSTFTNALLRLAIDSDWLLANGLGVVGRQPANTQYAQLLHDRGFSSYRGKVLDVEKLVTQFTSFYGSRLLAQLGCHIATRVEHSWLIRMVRRQEDRQQHPLQHLLFIQWLDLTAQEFFALPTTMRVADPFGPGPWFCRNPVCPRLGRPTISECTITFSAQTGYPIGTCACPVCLYCYRLTGSSRDRKDEGVTPARADQVVEFGPLWEAALVAICTDCSIPVKRKAQLLGLDYETLSHKARERGVAIVGPRGVAEKYIDFPSPRVSKEVAHPEIVSRRRIWAALVRESGKEGVAALRQSAPATYSWLYRHDREWLRAHKPNVGKKRNVARPRVDWTIRDAELAGKVREAAVSIKMRGTPTRVTVHALSCLVGTRGSLAKHITRAPLTSEVLSEVCESAQEFAIRRLQWAVALYQQAGVIPTASELVKRAGLSRQLKSAMVRAAFVDALAHLGIVQTLPIGSASHYAA